MGVVKAATVFESVTGLPEDRVVHDLHFRWDGPIGPTDGELTELGEKIEAFYNTKNGAMTYEPCAYLSGELSRAAGAARTRMFRYDDIAHPEGSPQVERPFTLGAARVGYASLPAEVACCVSYNADLTGVQVEIGDTRPAARRKGRLYFGPLNNYVFALGPNAAGVQRPSADFQTDLRRGLEELRLQAGDIMALNAGLFLSVYSQSDNAVRGIVAVSTDNAFDVQRRRGSKATARIALALDPE